jgi:hypothetical protein
MAAYVGFSDGGTARVSNYGWGFITERTCRKLTDAGLSKLCDQIYEYGVDLDLDPEEVRVPLARAMLDAARELETELAPQHGWDVERQGPLFGELVARLEREVAVGLHDTAYWSSASRRCALDNRNRKL